MKIVRISAHELLVRERSDVARFDQNNVIGILDFAFDEQKCFFSDQKTKSFKQVWIDNRI
jgi:hypothetical protein